MPLILAFLALLATSAFAQDIEGSADHPAIGRFEGTSIERYDYKDYDAQSVLTVAEPRTFETFEGEVTKIIYDKSEDTSLLQVIRSFQQKLEGEGFETLLDCDDDACRKVGVGRMRDAIGTSRLGIPHHILTLKREDEAGLIHAQIVADKKRIFINVVENAAMENKAIDAVAIQNELMAEGRMAFYDIHFDTGSANLTADSDATIGLIAEVLEGDADLSIVVVGHTDSVGSLDSNLALSRNRAQAVVDRLVSRDAITSDRVTGAGVAFLAPVTSNATEKGRALNRRVEIVVR